MRGYFTRSGSCVAPAGTESVDVSNQLRELVMQQTDLASVAIKSVRLYYVRQTVGEIEKKKIVYYFEPEFIYVLDIGLPRLALVSLPYQVPVVKAGDWEYRTIGKGDGEFPDFREGVVLSGASIKDRDVLYAASAGKLLVGAKENVTEAQLRAALSSHVLDLRKDDTHYVARIAPFDEEAVAVRILAEVDLVRYAELDVQMRSTAGPWWVDRVI